MPDVAGYKAKLGRTEPAADGLAWTPARDLAAIGVLVGLALVIAGSRIVLRPEWIYDPGWVIGEGGNQLFRGDLVRAGRLMYRDFACPYGPLPTYIYGALGTLLGNTIPVNYAYHVGLRLVALVLFYALMRRSFDPGSAFVLGLAAGLPSVLFALGAYVHHEYISCEVVALLVVFALYDVPGRRGAGRCWALGAALGLCQWVKFGGAIVAGAAIVTTDVLAMLRGRPEGAVPGRWLLGLLRVLAGFLLVEGLLAALLVLTCPVALARDTLWPSYMLANYAEEARAERYPSFAIWRFFVCQQWLPLSCLALGLIALLRGVRTGFRAAPPGAPACYVGLAFYLIGTVLYFKHRYLFYQYAWTLVPAGCLAVGRLPGRLQVPILISWAPTLAVVLKATFLSTAPAAPAPLTLPGGERIYATAGDRELLRSLTALVARLHRDHPGRAVVFANAWSGLGFYHFLSPPPRLRNLYFVPHGLRPYDVAELGAKLDTIGAFILLAGDGPSGGALLWRALPGDLKRAVRRHFAAREVRDGGRAWFTVLERVGPEPASARKLSSPDRSADYPVPSFGREVLLIDLQVGRFLSCRPP